MRPNRAHRQVHERANAVCRDNRYYGMNVFVWMTVDRLFLQINPDAQMSIESCRSNVLSEKEREKEKVFLICVAREKSLKVCDCKLFCLMPTKSYENIFAIVKRTVSIIPWYIEMVKTDIPCPIFEILHLTLAIHIIVSHIRSVYIRYVLIYSLLYSTHTPVPICISARRVEFVFCKSAKYAD